MHRSGRVLMTACHLSLRAEPNYERMCRNAVCRLATKRATDGTGGRRMKRRLITLVLLMEIFALSAAVGEEMTIDEIIYEGDLE